MTIYITDVDTMVSVAFNTPNLADSLTFTLTSQWSNTETVSVPLTLVESNDRYSEFFFTVPADLANEHKNGIYDYQLLDGLNVVESGLCKLILEPGGTYGTEEYISNNDDREADVYYRPEY